MRIKFDKWKINEFSFIYIRDDIDGAFDTGVRIHAGISTNKKQVFLRMRHSSRPMTVEKRVVTHRNVAFFQRRCL